MSTKQNTLEKKKRKKKEKKNYIIFEGSTVQMYSFMVVKQGWISRKVLKHGISLVLRYVLCSYLSLFYL